MSDKTEDEDEITIDNTDSNEDLEEIMDRISETELFQEDFKKIDSDIEELTDRSKQNTEKINELKRNVKDLEEQHNEHIEDIRGRVVQVAKMIQERSKEDHSHPEIESQVEKIISHMEELESKSKELESTVDTLSRNVEDFREDHNDLYDKATRLASAHLTLRDEFDSDLNNRNEFSEELFNLREIAQDKKITEAKCEDCSELIMIPYLNENECPECNSKFISIEGRFLRSDILVTENETKATRE